MRIEQEFIIDIEVRLDGKNVLEIIQERDDGSRGLENIALDKVGAEKLIERLKEFIASA